MLHPTPGLVITVRGLLQDRVRVPRLTSSPTMSPHVLQRLTLALLLLTVQLTSSSAIETTVAPRQQQRVPKTPRTTTTTTTAAPTTSRRIATHPQWPNDPTTRKPIKIATHAPWPGDPGFNRATHAPYPFHRNQFGLSAESEHLFPSRSTYAPYVYGSTSGSHDAKKKNLLSVFDRETVNTWTKDIIAYLAAPFMMPSAISNAIGNIPSGLEADSLWGRIAKSVKSALNRRSEERNAGQASPDNKNVLMRMKKKLASTGFQSLASLISKRFRTSDSPAILSQSSAIAAPDSKRKSVDKKFRDLVFERLFDFLRVSKVHPSSSKSSKSPQSASSSAAATDSSPTSSASQ